MTKLDKFRQRRAAKRGAGGPILCMAMALGIAGTTLLPASATAEEGGSGHYLPGSIASFIDSVPPTETFIVRFNGLGYIGSASAQRPIPFARLAVAGAKADVWGAGLTLLWRPPIELGGSWSYAMNMTIPCLSSDISANAVAALGNGLSASVARQRTVDGIGNFIPTANAYNCVPFGSIESERSAVAQSNRIVRSLDGRQLGVVDRASAGVQTERRQGEHAATRRYPAGSARSESLQVWRRL